MTRHLIDDRDDARDASELSRFARLRAEDDGAAAPALEPLRRQPRLADRTRAQRYASIQRGREA